MLADKAVTNLANSVLQRRDSFISTITSPIPKDILNKLRSSPLLDDLLFDLSSEDVDLVKKRRNERFMYHAIKARPTPPSFPVQEQRPQHPFRAKRAQRPSRPSSGRQESARPHSSKPTHPSGTQIQQSQVSAQQQFKSRSKSRSFKGKQSKWLSAVYSVFPSAPGVSSHLPSRKPTSGRSSSKVLDDLEGAGIRPLGCICHQRRILPDFSYSPSSFSGSLGEVRLDQPNQEQSSCSAISDFARQRLELVFMF